MADFTKEETKNYFTTQLAVTDTPCAITIGGKSVDKFVPNVNFSKWHDECWLNVNHRDTVVTTESASLSTDKISQTVGDLTHAFYETAEGHLEWDIEIAKPTASNVITLSLDYPEGLAFHYQTELTEWEREHGFDRPEKVVGSYAVYWKKGNNEYKTGKFCHIYRPQVIDANGDKVWGELKFDERDKTLSITIPQDWLDKAAYPIRQAAGAEFGVTSNGGSWVGDSGYVYCSKRSTTTEAGTVTNLHAYVKNNDASNARNCKFGMYNTTSNEPDALLGGTIIHNLAAASAAAWVDCGAYSCSISASSDYWFAKNPDNTNYQVAYDSVDTGGYRSLSYLSSLANPFGARSNLSLKMSFHAVYTPAAAGASIAALLAGMKMAGGEDSLTGGLME